jgi:hypothetical protein
MVAAVAHVAAQLVAHVAHLLAFLPGDVMPPPLG